LQDKYKETLKMKIIITISVLLMMSQIIMVANLNQYTKGLNSDVSDYFSTGLGFEASKSKFLKRDFESYKIKKLLGMFN